MNIESHKKAIKESLEEIRESVQVGLEKRQRTIGFHCSAVVADILELYLHAQNLIEPGTIIKHDFFSSMRVANERIKVDFPNKDKIFSLVNKLETKRNLLCYGKSRSKDEIEKYIDIFNKILKTFDNMGVKFE
jgi:hypothetical protein